MKARLAGVLSMIVFAVYGLWVIPRAILCHQHLFWDGSVFFIHALGGGIDVDHRIFHHGLTQLPVVGLVRAGVHDIRLLAVVYGALLFYVAFLPVLAANIILIRFNRFAESAFLAICFSLMFTYVGFFVVTEGFLAATSFILALVVSACCGPSRARTATLVAVALLSFACYESWAVFGMIMAAVLWKKDRALALTFCISAMCNLFLVLHPIRPALMDQRDSFLRIPVDHLLTPGPWISCSLRGILFLMALCFAAFMLVPIVRKSQAALVLCGLALPGVVLFGMMCGSSGLAQWSAYLDRIRLAASGHEGVVYATDLDPQINHWSLPDLSVVIQAIDKRNPITVVDVYLTEGSHGRLHKRTQDEALRMARSLEHDRAD